MMKEDTAAGGGDVENPMPESAAEIEADAPPSKAAAVYGGGAVRNKKTKAIAISAFLLVAVVLAIVLGVTLGPSSSNDEAANVSTPDAGTVGGPDPVDPTVPLDATTSTSSTLPSDATAADAPNTNTEGTPGKNTDSTEPAVAETTAATKPAIDALPKEEFLQSSGPLSSRVRIISPRVAEGYTSCDGLKDDIEAALMYYADSIIVQQAKYDWYEDSYRCNPDNQYWYGQAGGAPVPEAGVAFTGDSAAAAPVADMDMGESAQGAAAPAKVTEDSFGTNNQVAGVDEADIAKSNGEHVFAAYGDVLYAWKAENGTKGVSITEMPYEPATDCDYKPPPPYEPHPPGVVIFEDTEVAAPAVEVTSVSSPSSGQGSASSQGFAATSSASAPGGKRHLRNSQRKDLSIMRPPDWNPCQKPKPRIVSLLLRGTSRLTAVVSESENMPYYGYYREEMDAEQSVLNDRVKLTVRVYDISNVPNNRGALKLVGEKEINGNYRDARSIGDNGFVVTTSTVNTGLFARPLYRSNPEYCGMNADEYKERAAAHAKNNTAAFMEKMVNELQLQLDGTCDSIFQVAAMQSGDSVEAHSGSDMLGQFVQVQSFDMTEEFTTTSTEKQLITNELTTKQAGGFSSGWLDTVYASQGLVATLSNGGAYNKDAGEWEQSTFVLGFDTNGPAPRPFSYAEVRGTPLNQYSVDFYDGHLRLVTQERRRRTWSTDTGTLSESSTLNKIVVLKVPGAGEGPEMKMVGQSGHVGKPNESVYSVRFIQDKAYIVTFERIDPFYIYDLSNHSMPQKLGELEIPGFSNYLHPIQIDGVPLMLGIGEHVDETTTWRRGVKISLFDISNSSNPTESAPPFIDEDAYSTVGNDFKAFRYLPESQKLILPKSEWKGSENGNFDGFVVYDISINEIKPSYEIQHASSYDMYHYCWSSSRMPARSFVFKSKLTTILTHTVISTDLDTGKKLWGLNLDEGLNNTVCNPYFY